jgi:hypothetical protein
MAKKTKIKIIKQNYPKDITDNPYRIFKCQLIDNNPDIVVNKYGTFTLKGELPYLLVGKEYDLELEKEDYNPKWGQSYTTSTLPGLDIGGLTTDEQKHLLLCFSKGKKLVDNILNAYPDFVNMIINGESDKIDINKIHGMGEYTFNLYKKNIEESFVAYYIKAKLARWELSVDESAKLMRLYGTSENIEAEILEHPYQIYCKLLDRPFKKADTFIIRELPDFEVSAERTEWYIVDILKSNEADGNTRLNANDMLHYLPKSLWPLAVKTVKNSENIYYCPENKMISIAQTYNNEALIAQTLNTMFTNSKRLEDVDTSKYWGDKGARLTDNQHALLDIVKEFNVCMLVGPAGTGKSTTIKSLTQMLSDYDITFRLLAPTGIAAKVLANATGYKAQTIHLACLNQDISEEVIIVDEISMVSVNTMAMLCKYLDTTKRLILIGDMAQLPSIGAGNVMRDLISSQQLPYVTLNRVFRFGVGGIDTVATNIRKSNPYVDNSGDLLFEMQEPDYKFISVIENCVGQVIAVYKKLLTKYSYKDILILSPWNKGNHGTAIINSEIQKMANHSPTEVNVTTRLNGRTVQFFVGDKVMHHIKNDYSPLTLEEYEYQQDILNNKTPAHNLPPMEELAKVTVMNGEIGYVRDILDNDKVLVGFDDNKNIVYDNSKLKYLTLAQSISCHKSQGSEAKAVIVVTHPEHNNMLNKNLLYTAVTRAKEMLIQIGDPTSINRAIQIDETMERNTWIKELMMEGRYATDYD